MAQTGRGPSPGEHPAQWDEDALPEGVGIGHAGGGTAPTRQMEEQDAPPVRGAVVPPLALLVALAVIAVPALWALGYWLGGAPGARSLWPLALVALAVTGVVLGYWLARRGGQGEEQDREGA